ncbi:thrombospondin type 3 repeat-containing protein [Maribacter sp. 4G9]|uniref:thrombospondin type 3 repeat-containing protein n=1 Tax=Maribacter sp. 4G9 TaxID=1889777 RepID=UPI000C154F64|nr:thrombospondin type 3 repeat-containing protein [Maribacter sp. 4G9]
MRKILLKKKHDNPSKQRHILFFASFLLFLGQIMAQTTFADNFSSISYSNSDGNTPWATDWTESGDSNLGPTAQYIRIQSQQLYMYWLWTEEIRRTVNLTGATSAILSFDYTSNSLGGTRQLGVYISSTGGAPYTQIGTLSGNGTFTQDISAYISANTVIRFAKSNANWNSDDNASIDNVLISAIIPVDTDGDGIEDVADLDNDNDGILDWDECTFVATTTQNFTASGGTSVTNTATSGFGSMYIDFISIDNSFNLTVNGTNIATEFQFQPGAPGNFARFDTGFTYGQAGVPQLWSMTGTLANPMLRVIVDADGNLKLFGAQSPGGTLLPLTLDTPPVTVPWNPSGTNTITIGQLVTGPTNMNGQLRFSGECDTDGDGIFNRFDLDSDNDGIYDAVEAGHGQAHTNGVVNGAIGTDGIPNLVQTDPNGGSVNYTYSDSDGDGILDSIALDSDNDGCNDVLEAGFTDDNTDGLLGPNPVTTDVNGVVTSGTDGYTVPADGNSDAVFDYRQAGAPPSITTQPTNTIICPGCSGSLSVSATNADLYQWQRFIGGVWTDISDNAMFSGANSATLNISNPTPSQNGEQYRVVMDNLAYTCAQTTSTIANLQIQVNTIITNRRITYRVQKN